VNWAVGLSYPQNASSETSPSVGPSWPVFSYDERSMLNEGKNSDTLPGETSEHEYMNFGIVVWSSASGGQSMSV